MTDFAAAAATAEVLTDGRRPMPDAAAAHLIADEAAGRCANCETPLRGDWCHACGQRAHLHARLRDLVHEAVEGIAHFDGRLWRTLPLLAFNPGRLSREWREGRRVRYVAPFSTFLFAIFLVFLIPSVTGRHLISLPDMVRVEGAELAGNSEAERAAEAMRRLEVDAAAAGSSRAAAWQRDMAGAFRERFQNSDYYGYRIESLLYKLSFMLVPISMIILSVLMAFRRGYSFYDHGVVSLYGVGFLALCVAGLLLMSAIMAPFGYSLATWLPQLLSLGFLAHAVAHLKGAYALGWPGAVIRGLLLGLFSAIGFGLFMISVVLLGLFA